MSQSVDLTAALDQIRSAAERLKPHIRTTPTVYSYTFSEVLGTDVYLKLENLQRTGSFKVRGALNRILTLPNDARERGLIAASAGNHAQGVALAAKLAGCSAKIVMPEGTALMKVDRTRDYGADVVLFGRNYDEAASHALEIAEREGRTAVHPFDEWEVIYGQGTVGLEIAEQVPELGVVVLPVGGGGLIAGVALALRALRPDVRVIGVQAEGASPMVQSIQEGEKRVVDSPRTLAEGIRVGAVGDLTFEVVRHLVDKTVTVTEDEIAAGVVELMEKNKVVAEAAAVTPIAAILAGKISTDRTLCAVITGGNIDLSLVGRLIEFGMAQRGQLANLRLRMPDEPGLLRVVLEAVESERANVVEVRHDRSGWKVPVGAVEVEILISTRASGVGIAIAKRLNDLGLDVIEPLIC